MSDVIVSIETGLQVPDLSLQSLSHLPAQLPRQLETHTHTLGSGVDGGECRLTLARALSLADEFSLSLASDSASIENWSL